jgi:hypothetical protein
MRVGNLDIMRSYIPLIEGVGLTDFHRLNVQAQVFHTYIEHLCMNFCSVSVVLIQTTRI